MPQLELSGDRLCDGGDRAGQSLGCALGCILAGEQGKQGWAEGQGDLKAVPTGLKRCRRVLYQLSHKGNPRIPKVDSESFGQGI